MSWPAESEVSDLREEVASKFGVPPEDVRVVASPFRVCPLGAHIDHQGGTVVGMAVTSGVLLAFAPAGEPTVTLASHNFQGEVEFSLGAIPEASQAGEGEEGGWGKYARGAAKALHNAGHALAMGIKGVVSAPKGLDGGGISSSAATGVAYLLALEAANGLEVSPEQNVQLDKDIENGYLGLKNGILDQSAVLYSKAGHLTVIKCLDGTHSLLRPFWKEGEAAPFKVLLAFSGLRQALLDSSDFKTEGAGCSNRVDECARAAAALVAAAQQHGYPARGGGEASILGHIGEEDYSALAGALDSEPALRKRAEHFFSECARVQMGLDSWCDGDIKSLGWLMTVSGESSIVNYEVGAPPLVALRQILLDTPGVLGARFSGAGFRGCVVALVRPEDAEAAAASVAEAYAKAEPELAEQSQVLVLDSGDGARIL